MADETDDKLAASWHELMGRYNQLTCRLDRELRAAHDLSSSEFEVLQQLAGATNGKLKMADLAEQVHLSQSALSRLVSRLESDGLVCRDMCIEDRRSVFASITAEGRKLYKAARPTQRAILRDEAGECSQLATGVLLPESN